MIESGDARGVVKCLWHLHIFELGKMIKPWFFFEKMRDEKHYKNRVSKSPLMCSNDFFLYSEWTIPMVVLKIKMFKKVLCFAYISTSENNKILIFILTDAPFKALHKQYKKYPIALLWWLFVKWLKKMGMCLVL